MTGQEGKKSQKKKNCAIVSCEQLNFPLCPCQGITLTVLPTLASMPTVIKKESGKKADLVRFAKKRKNKSTFSNTRILLILLLSGWE